MATAIHPFRDEFFLVGCQCDRHGLNKRQFSNAVKRGNKSRSQAFAVGLVVAVPAAQGVVAGVGEKKRQRRRFNVASEKRPAKKNQSACLRLATSFFSSAKALPLLNFKGIGQGISRIAVIISG
jgi:hypothetical protein